MLYWLLYRLTSSTSAQRLSLHHVPRGALAIVTALVFGLLLGGPLIRALREPPDPPVDPRRGAGRRTRRRPARRRWAGCSSSSPSSSRCSLWGDLTEPLGVGRDDDHAPVRRHRLPRRLPQGRRAARTSACAPGRSSGSRSSSACRGRGRDPPRRRPRPARRRAHVAVLQERAARPRLALRPVRRLRAGRLLQRGQPDRRPRRSGDRLGADRVRHLHDLLPTSRATPSSPRYLQIPPVTGAGEVTVFCAAMVGASLAFLWFNCHPAQVFMGDVGSLALGAAIGCIGGDRQAGAAAGHRRRPVRRRGAVGDPPGRELQDARPAASSACRRCTTTSSSGGWAETQVVVRFWIVASVFALVGPGDA